MSGGKYVVTSSGKVRAVDPTVQEIVARCHKLERENRRLRENYNELAALIDLQRSRKDYFKTLPHPLPVEEAP